MLSSANSTRGWTLRHPHVFSLEDLTCTNPEDIAPHQEHGLLVLGLDPDLPIEHGVEGVMGEPEGLLREDLLTACRKGGRQSSVTMTGSGPTACGSLTPRGGPLKRGDSRHTQEEVVCAKRAPLFEKKKE